MRGVRGAREVRACGEPEVFVAGCEALEGLEEEREGLSHGGPGGWVEDGAFVLAEGCCCGAVEVLVAGGRDERVC